MKRILTIIALVAISMFAMAQTNQLVWANGRLIYGTSIETIDSLTYGGMEEVDTLHLLLPRTLIKVVYDTVYVHDTIYINNCDPETPEVGTHEYVDLGLSVKWATCNVGATTPEDYGDYFAWGEVEPQEYYGCSPCPCAVITQFILLCFSWHTPCATPIHSCSIIFWV